MNRAIKFRVWDNQSKCWVGKYSHDWVGTGIGNAGSPDEQPWKCMSLKGEIMSNDNMGGFVDSNQKIYDIQQYTGIKDKNGKEIYEGDIVKSGNVLMICEYNAPEFDFKYRNNDVFDYKDENGNVKKGWWSRSFADLYCDPEVVGNTFENPNLME